MAFTRKEQDLESAKEGKFENKIPTAVSMFDYPGAALLVGYISARYYLITSSRDQG